MAIFGRRKPHAPIILAPTSLAPPPIGKIVYPRKAALAQAAAQFAHRPPHAPIFLGLGQPQPIGALVYPQKMALARAAAIFAHRPPHAPIILGLGQPQPIGSIVTPNGQRTSQAAALFARRPMFRPIILAPTVLPATLAPPIGEIVYPAKGGLAQATALAAHRPLFRPIVLKAGSPAAVAAFIIRRDRTTNRIYYRQKTRLLFNTFLAPPVNLAPPIGANLIVQRGARDAALFDRRPLFKPIFKTVGPPQPIGSIISPRGQGTSQAAALAGRRPYIYKPFVGIINTFAPQAAAAPRWYIKF